MKLSFGILVSETADLTSFSG